MVSGRILHVLDHWVVCASSKTTIHDLWYGITYNFGIIILFFTDDQFVSSGRSSQRLSFVDDPLSNQRLSFVSVDGSEIDSDYSSASSVVPASSEEQKNLE